MRLFKTVILVAIVGLLVVVAGVQAQDVSGPEYSMFAGGRYEDGGNKAVCVGMKLPPIAGISSLVYADISQNAQIEITPTQWAKARFFGLIDYVFLFTGAAFTWADVRPDNVRAILGGVGGFGFYKGLHTSKEGIKTGIWLTGKVLTPLPNADNPRFTAATGIAFTW
ncbi:MAG: hypothetical protein HY851_08770 [candidate division Zixibacteria bacterium]|nr:hypothetical protein [candidate division Zixibacteria bacterium]